MSSWATCSARCSILPQPQREALILVGAGGFAYEEAAEICGCAVGTIKSRVARGRVALEALLSEGKLPSRRQPRHKTDPDASALRYIMGEVDDLSRDRDGDLSSIGAVRPATARAGPLVDLLQQRGQSGLVSLVLGRPAIEASRSALPTPSCTRMTAS